MIFQSNVFYFLLPLFFLLIQSNILLLFAPPFFLLIYAYIINFEFYFPFYNRSKKQTMQVKTIIVSQEQSFQIYSPYIYINIYFISHVENENFIISIISLHKSEDNNICVSTKWVCCKIPRYKMNVSQYTKAHLYISKSYDPINVDVPYDTNLHQRGNQQ